MNGFVKPATVDGEDRGSSYFPQASRFTVHHVGPSYHQSTGRPGLETLLVHSAPSAAFNSKVRSFDTPKCDEDTRVGLIDEILAWSNKEDPDTSNMLCMTGSAGSGKSALAQTVAEFGASRPHIVNAVETDPSIFTKSLDCQAEVLLLAPVKEALCNPPPPPSLIVVDGLDECKGENDQEQAQQEQILCVLHRCARELPFRIFLTSRPESAIREALAPDGFLDAGVYQILLNNHDATKDIQLYLERKLRAILRSNVPEGWTFQGIIKFLVKQADSLFVHATTVVKFVGQRQQSPLRRLKIVLEGRPQQGTHPLAKLDALYSSILFAAQAAYDDEDAYASEPSSFIHRFWTLYMMKLTWHYLPLIEEFLYWDAGDIERVVEDLHSVFQGFLKDGRIFRLRFYHKSFQDYLEDPERCAELGVARLPTCHTLLSISLDRISSASAEECSKCLESRDNPLLASSVKLLPQLLSTSGASPIEDMHISSFNRVVKALRRFSACGGWDKLLKAFTNKFERDSHQQTCQLIELKNSSRRGAQACAEPRGDRPYDPDFIVLRSDLAKWIDLQDKILALVAWEDRTDVLHFFSAFRDLAKRVESEPQRIRISLFLARDRQICK